MDISEKSKSNEAFSAILFLIDEFIGERAAKFRKKPYICRKMTRFYFSLMKFFPVLMKFSPIPFVLTILMLAVCQHVRAQEWRMVITQTDGTRIEMPTAGISDVTFTQSAPGTVSLDHPLRVLVLGNSYALDATAYLDELVEAAHIDRDQLGVYVGVINGGQFSDWTGRYKYGSDVVLQKMAGNIVMKDKASVKELLHQEWDLIVVLHVSNKSYVWSTFEETLPELLEIIRENCPNKQVEIAYQIPWGHTEDVAETELAGNIECARKLADGFGITHLIPVGTAVQNARNTSLNTSMYMTRDNWHLCMGVGRYVAACTFFESVIAPLAHVSVLGNEAVHPITDEEKRTYNGSVAVDASNRRLCQLCAFYAVKDPFNVTAISEK